MARPGENVPKLLPAEGPRGVMQVNWNVAIPKPLYAISVLGTIEFQKCMAEESEMRGFSET